MSARMSAPRARRLVAAGVIATVLTAGSVGAAAATPVEDPAETAVEAPAGPEAPVEERAPVDAPAEEEAPAEDEAPVEEQTPAEDAAPVEDAPSSDEGTPVDEGTPSDEGTPVDEDAPVDEGTPSDEGAPSDEEEDPDGVEVARPTVQDKELTFTAGETLEVDLSELVTLGDGVLESIEVYGGAGDIQVGFNPDTHILTLSAWEGGTGTLHYVAYARTEGSDELQESNEGTLSLVALDAPKPQISWAATPAASTTSTTARFTVNVDAGDYVLGYVLDLHPEAQSASPVMVEGNTFELTGLAVGRHTIRVVVERGAGWSPLDFAWDVVAPGAPAAPATPVAAPVLSPDAIPASVVRAGLRRGATGESVAIIQRVVGVEADGRFGAATRAAVIAFQRAHGLVADGIVGPLTWAAIVDVANGGTGSATVSATSIPAAQIARGISRGASGSSVSVIQRIVGANPDGRFGPRTQAAVRAWQRSHGLVADGIVGRLTWAAMVAR